MSARKREESRRRGGEEDQVITHMRGTIIPSDNLKIPIIKNNINGTNVTHNMKKDWNYDAIFGHDINQKTSSSYKSFPKLLVEFFSYGH